MFSCKKIASIYWGKNKLNDYKTKFIAFYILLSFQDSSLFCDSLTCPVDIIRCRRFLNLFKSSSEPTYLIKKNKDNQTTCTTTTAKLNSEQDQTVQIVITRYFNYAMDIDIRRESFDTNVYQGNATQRLALQCKFSFQEF